MILFLIGIKYFFRWRHRSSYSPTPDTCTSTPCLPTQCTLTPYVSIYSKPTSCLPLLWTPRPCTPALCRLNPCTVSGTCEMIANLPTLDKSLKQHQPPLGCNWEMPIAAFNTDWFVVDFFSTFQFTRNFSPILHCWIYMQMKTMRSE
jgi:hypothetical protein